MGVRLRLRSGFLAFALTTWPATSPRLFEGEEHRELGDLALRVALDYTSFRHGHDCLSGHYASARTLVEGASDSQATYGELVALVDHMLSPEELFTDQGKMSTYPSSQERLNDQFVGALPGGKRKIDTFLHGMKSRYLRASSENDAHFQDDLMFAAWRWHRLAVTLAIDAEESLFAALVANAISDHYLQDSFAPGHVVAARDNSHDTFALALHDQANAAGADYYIDREHWPELREILEDFVHPNRARYSLEQDGLDQLRQDPSFVRCFGDGLLKRGSAQYALMLLVEVRSILDVLESFESRTATNHLSEFEWLPSEGRRRGGLPWSNVTRGPIARTRYGGFGNQVDEQGRLTDEGDLTAIATDIGTVLGVSVGYESFLTREGGGRATASLEFVRKFAVSGSPNYVRDAFGEPLHGVNWAPVFGATWVEDDRYRGLGPSVRLVWGIPMIDSQFGLYARYLHYGTPREDDWKVSGGVRGDIGFSVLTAYVALGREWQFDDDLEPGTALSFGLTLSGPARRLGRLVFGP